MFSWLPVFKFFLRMFGCLFYFFYHCYVTVFNSRFACKLTLVTCCSINTQKYITTLVSEVCFPQSTAADVPSRHAHCLRILDDQLRGTNSFSIRAVEASRAVHTYDARCCAAPVKPLLTFYSRRATARGTGYVWTPPLKYIELLSLAQQRAAYLWTAS